VDHEVGGLIGVVRVQGDYVIYVGDHHQGGGGTGVGVALEHSQPIVDPAELQGQAHRYNVQLSSSPPWFKWMDLSRFVVRLRCRLSIQNIGQPVKCRFGAPQGCCIAGHQSGRCTTGRAPAASCDSPRSSSDPATALRGSMKAAPRSAIWARTMKGNAACHRAPRAGQAAASHAPQTQAAWRLGQQRARSYSKDAVRSQDRVRTASAAGASSGQRRMESVLPPCPADL